MFKPLTIIASLLWSVSMSHAAPALTTRIPQFSNAQVDVWKTIIYPTAGHALKMHRHEHDRVLVALESGTLKITNDNGKVHMLKLQKNKAYYLSRDIPNELHMDENITSHPIKVLVVELKK